MASSPLIDVDTFNLCWNAILAESKDLKNSFFNDKHCTLDDIRDINFDTIENRLAYMYKFGCYNILFVEKCIASFLEHSEAENVFSRENLTISSLSNGPGLDLIGLLYALYKSSTFLKCFPVLNAINAYDSWWSIFKRIVTTVFHVNSSSSSDSFHLPYDSIHLIKSDIYSIVSPEAEECIKDSDVLLMVKVFASTKASADVVEKSIKKIFSLLKPEAFIFFVGSKKNAKELSENSSLRKFVSFLHGPTKITLKDLPVDENIVTAINIKPKDSGSAYFIVWKKKDTELPQEIMEKKKKRTRRKKNKSKIKQAQKELTDNYTAISDFINDTATESEISLTSCSRQSGSLSVDSRTVSHENLFQPIVGNSVGEEHHLSHDLHLSMTSITSLVNKINLGHSNNKNEILNDTQDNIESGDGSISDRERNVQEKEFGTCVQKNEIITQTQNKDNEISVKRMGDEKIVLNEISLKEESQLVKESFQDRVSINAMLIPQLTEKPNLLQKGILPSNNNICLLEKSNIIHSSNKEEIMADVQQNTVPSIIESVSNLAANLEERNFQSCKTAQNIMTTTNEIDPSKGNCISKPKNEESTPRKFSHSKLILEGICGEANTNHTSNKGNSKNKIFQHNEFPSVIQTITKKAKKKSKKIVELPKKNEMQSLIKGRTSLIQPNIENKIDKGSKPVCDNLSLNQCYENYQCIRKVTTHEEVNDRNKHDFHLLLNRCDNLVASLEELTANFKMNVNSLNNNQNSSCCKREICTKFRIPHSCISSCSFNTIHSGCCRNICNCQIIQNNTCIKSHHCRADVNRIHECIFETKRSMNVSKPYIVIPVQNEDVLQILTTKDS